MLPLIAYPIAATVLYVGYKMHKTAPKKATATDYVPPTASATASPFADSKAVASLNFSPTAEEKAHDAAAALKAPVTYQASGANKYGASAPPVQSLTTASRTLYIVADGDRMLRIGLRFNSAGGLGTIIKENPSLPTDAQGTRIAPPAGTAIVVPAGVDRGAIDGAMGRTVG